MVFVRTPKLQGESDEYDEIGRRQGRVSNNKGCRFEPHVLGIRVGQTLVIKNSDPVAS